MNAGAGITLELSNEVLEALTDRVVARVQQRPRFLSRAALANHLGITERQVRTMREKGLPGVKVGKVVLYDLPEVDRWIEARG